MSHEIRKLYQLLEVAPDCSDKELRDSYRALLRRHHPDLNENSTDSTYLTQHLIAAYERLTEYRQTYAATSQAPLRDEHNRTPFAGFSISVSATVGNPFALSLSRILELKRELRDAWREFETRQYDVNAALRFIRGALRGGRPELVEELLRNRTLIASAPFLAEIYNPDDAGRIALVWAQRLRDLNDHDLAIALLQDIAGIEGISSLIAETLKESIYSLHYNVVRSSRSGQPDASPSKRIDHLRAIIDLGYKAGYIYKQIAEAFHDLGDDEQARLNLQRALAIDPELTGAKTIMRALGFLGDDKPRHSASAARKIYLYTRPDQIPSTSTIIAWFENEN
ncbi:MAG TPA: J domain-containing protein [Bryobacteraceae bacterium]|nr:J domain-containing protein [Bryobacteraceae bacterium]